MIRCNRKRRRRHRLRRSLSRPWLNSSVSNTTRSASLDLDSIRIERRKTSEYFELGRLATALQDEIGYGNWGAYLENHHYVERTVSRALRIYDNLKDHKELCIGLTLSEAEKFGDRLAAVAKDEEAKIAESVARSRKSASTRVGAKANAARAELRKKVIEALASTDGLETELRSILEPTPIRHVGEPVSAVPAADQQLLLESDGARSTTLKQLYHGTHPEGFPLAGQDVEDWQHGDDPCVNCEWIGHVLAEVVNDEDIGITDEEHAAFSEFVAKFPDEARALRVMLALAHDTLC